MIPFNLLFKPPAIIRNCPARDWRKITLWLKWGLLFSIGTIMLKVLISSDPAEISYVFVGLEWLNDYHDTVTIPLPLQFALFFIFESLAVVIAWTLKGAWIVTFYRLLNEKLYFNEAVIAFSIAGASLVTNIWHLLPYGTLLAGIHALILTTYLSSKVNRVSTGTAILIGLSGLIPVLY